MYKDGVFISELGPVLTTPIPTLTPPARAALSIHVDPKPCGALQAKLSPALKGVRDDPQYHQINEPLRFSYPDRGQPRS